MINIPVFLSADDNYAPYIATTIASICSNTKSFIDFYVLADSISDKNKSLILKLKETFSNFSIEFIDINTDKYFSHYPASAHYSKVMYARFLIPELKPQLDKVLYSDVDVIVLKDIKEMFIEHLDGYPIGAVTEEFLSKNNHCQYVNMLSINPTHQIFASGNLIIDCKKWRNENFSQKLLSMNLSNNSQIKYNDQILLNMFFQNNYKKLSSRYCYTIQEDECRFSDDVVICHYNGPIKPWHISEGTDTKLMPYLKEFWYYAKLTPFYESIKKNIFYDEKHALMKLRVMRLNARHKFEN